MHEILDFFARTYTPFASFAALLDAPADYLPQLVTHQRFPGGCEDTANRSQLADEYDAAQEARGDTRRTKRF